MNEQLRLALLAYQDGTLDAAGSCLLVAALAGADGAQVRQALAFDGLLGQALTADAAVERSVRERLAAETSASALVRAVHRSLPPRRPARGRRRAVAPWLAVAALLALVVGAAWWLGAPAPGAAAACRLVTVARVTVQRGGSAAAAAVGAPLHAGDQLSADAAATLAWPDGSRVTLAPGTQVRLGPGAGLHLAHGEVTAEIAGQRPGAPFVITSAEARVEVLGTHFVVRADARRTEVDLHRGAVRLTRLGDGRELTLQAQQGATVAAGVELVAHALAPPVTGPTAAPGGVPLFPASGLDGWSAQHGAWSNHDGVVRGADPHHGKARLISVHAFADLDLQCRLRIDGAPVAEVQVGDYNWFAEVPARGREWVDVRVQQRGEHLVVTADGVVLPLHAGAGAAARRGPLAFYVMPGGVLEISGAQVHVPPGGGAAEAAP